MNKRTGLILCGFPGIGKTATQDLAERKGNFGFIDAESSSFRWVQLLNGKRLPNSDFPGNYIDFVTYCAGKYKVTMTATHKQVRDEMKRRGLAYIIVAPEKSLKDEYILRYVARGSDMGLIEQVYDHWDEWLDELEKDGAPVIHLKSGQFLADAIVPECIRLSLRENRLREGEAE
ncbi:MAG: hypothetical protein IJS55_03245 [Oscillospiraceae bacterium]|nr:hypothetical protein [Oscillospiraceae bacterium]